ncbi:MAG TPA: heavy metal-binding domain-containing protein [Bacteroidales bacterium]|nr:hypothetical protein [Bacteroidales bacterium]HQH40228.1 heavy metal-binding domain-containing protein [Bacteroidales bacterium]HQK38236.1 heavy metal-binding domain-containing protein [Bacteroidales bacterium]
MKKQIFILVLAGASLFISACTSQSSKNQEKKGTETVAEKVYYTCPMHPEIKSDKPGECPICGMTLVKKEISSSDTIGSHQITDTTSVN